VIEVSEDVASNSSERSATTTQLHQDTSRDIAKPVRPKEFSLSATVPLVTLFAALSAGLVVVYLKARVHGKWNLGLVWLHSRIWC
jgi:hypothetical protein